jgi:hypothetical protein
LNRRRFLAALGVISTALCSGPVRAEDSSPPSLLDAINSLTEAFLNSLDLFRRIGAAGERQYLSHGLAMVNADLYALEDANRRIVTELLGRTRLNAPLLRWAGGVLSTHIRHLRTTLLDLVPRLGQQFGAAADRPIQLLGAALNARIIFAEALARTTEANRRDTLQKAQSAIIALQNCQRALRPILETLRH